MPRQTKKTRVMESPSDSADPLEQDRPDFQAPSTSDTIQDGDLMDLLETSEDEVEELPPEGPDSSSPPQDTMARKDTAPFVSKCPGSPRAAMR